MNEAAAGTISADPAGVGAEGAAAGEAAAKVAEFKNTIPEVYREKPYLKDVNSIDDLFKILDGAETLIGKRPGIPGNDASDEEWSTFYKSIGRPEEAAGYELPFPEAKTDTDKKYNEAMRDLIHKTGLTATQAKVFVVGHQKVVTDLSTGLAAEGEALNKSFDEMTASHFGDRQDKVMENAKGLIKEFTPDSFEVHVNGLSNEALLVMASVLDGVHAKYIAEDTAHLGGGGERTPEVTVSELRKKGVELQQTDAFKNSMHPGHAAAVAEWNAVYEQIGRVQEKLKK